MATQTTRTRVTAQDTEVVLPCHGHVGEKTVSKSMSVSVRGGCVMLRVPFDGAFMSAEEVSGLAAALTDAEERVRAAAHAAEIGPARHLPG